MNQKFNVSGMTCSACSANVEKNVKKLDGVQSVNVNLLANRMAVEYDEERTDGEQIIKAVVEAGYGASLYRRGEVKAADPESLLNPVENELAGMKNRLKVSFLFLLPILYISMGHMFNWPLPMWLRGEANAMIFALLQFLFILPIVYVNRQYFQMGFKTLLHRAPNMDSLIAIGSSAAIVYGIFAMFKIAYGFGHQDLGMVNQYSMDLYFESAATILTLITVGKYLETRSKGKTSEAITKLMDLTPKTAIVVRNGQELEVAIEEVIVNDIIVVKPGQSIPVDGIIIEGSSAIDESALTGESIPVDKQVGDKVIAATLNKSGSFKFKALKVGDDTTLAQIIQLVEDASSSKAPIARLADTISGIFVPVVIAIAVLAVVVWLAKGQSVEFALSIGIAVVVISCPCALGLATPVAIMVGTGRGAANGILIKSAEALETAHKINTVVLDKTGTITEGKPKVTDIVATEGISEAEMIRVAASIERPSEHSLADAIVEKASEMGIALQPTNRFKAVPGRGIVASIDNEEYFAGNLAWMNDNDINVCFQKDAEQLAENGKTPLYFARGRQFLGIIALADVSKPSSREAIEQFKAMGIDVIMLTGDNQKTAEAIQRELHIDKVIAEVLPQDKEREIRHIQESGKKVAMIGDGINDAPALVRADVGIAIGAGTDVAIESADIVLMKGDLLDAVTAIQLSKAVIRNIKQNLFWAFFYNGLGIPLAAGVFYSILGWKLSPMFAAAAMSLSSVTVVSNALRLRWFESQGINISQNENPGIDLGEEKGGEQKMEKVINIDGMSCKHCQARVEQALNAIEGVEARVDLDKKKAIVNLNSEVDDQVLLKAVNDAGYEALGIEKKKGA